MGWSVQRTWLGRYGWVVIIGAILVLGIWSLADDQAVRWVSTVLLVLGMGALAGNGIWRASRASRQ